MNFHSSHRQLDDSPDICFHSPPPFDTGIVIERSSSSNHYKNVNETIDRNPIDSITTHCMSSNHTASQYECGCQTRTLNKSLDSSPFYFQHGVSNQLPKETLAADLTNNPIMVRRFYSGESKQSIDPFRSSLQTKVDPFRSIHTVDKVQSTAAGGDSDDPIYYCHNVFPTSRSKRCMNDWDSKSSPEKIVIKRQANGRDETQPVGYRITESTSYIDNSSNQYFPSFGTATGDIITPSTGEDHRLNAGVDSYSLPISNQLENNLCMALENTSVSNYLRRQQEYTIHNPWPTSEHACSFSSLTSDSYTIQNPWPTSEHPCSFSSLTSDSSVPVGYHGMIHQQRRQPGQSCQIATSFNSTPDVTLNLHEVHSSQLSTCDSPPVLSHSSTPDLNKHWHDSVIATLPGTVGAVRIGTWDRLASMPGDAFAMSLSYIQKYLSHISRELQFLFTSCKNGLLYLTDLIENRMKPIGSRVVSIVVSITKYLQYTAMAPRKRTGTLIFDVNEIEEDLTAESASSRERTKGDHVTTSTVVNDTISIGMSIKSIAPIRAAARVWRYLRNSDQVVRKTSDSALSKHQPRHVVEGEEAWQQCDNSDRIRLQSTWNVDMKTSSQTEQSKSARLKRSRKSTSLSSLEVNVSKDQILEQTQLSQSHSSSASCNDMNTQPDPIALLNTMLSALVERFGKAQWAESVLHHSLSLWQRRCTAAFQGTVNPWQRLSIDSNRGSLTFNDCTTDRDSTASSQQQREDIGNTSRFGSPGKTDERSAREPRVNMLEQLNGGHFNKRENEQQFHNVSQIEITRDVSGISNIRQIDTNNDSNNDSNNDEMILQSQISKISAEQTANEIIRHRNSNATVVHQHPVVDTDQTHPEDQTEFAPLLGLTIYHFVNSLGIVEKKGTWEALLYLLTLLHNCKLDHLTVHQALLLCLILQDRRKHHSRQRILDNPEIRYRRSVSRPPPFIPWQDVRSMEIVWSLFVSFWLSLVWLEDRRTPILGWIEILQVLPEPTEYLQESSLCIPRPLHTRRPSLHGDEHSSILQTITSGDDSSYSNDGCRHRSSDRHHFEDSVSSVPLQYYNKLPSLCRPLSLYPLPPPSASHFSSSANSQLSINQSSVMNKSQISSISVPTTIVASTPHIAAVSRNEIPDVSFNGTKHTPTAQQILSRTFVRRSTTIRRRRLTVPRQGVSPVLTNLSTSTSSASCVLTNVPYQEPSADNFADIRMGKETSMNGSQLRDHRTIVRTEERIGGTSCDRHSPRDSHHCRSYEQSSKGSLRQNTTEFTYPLNHRLSQRSFQRNKSHWNEDKYQYPMSMISSSSSKIKQEQTPHHHVTTARNAAARHESAFHHQYSGAAYHLDQHHQRYLLNGGLQVGVRTAMRSRSHQTSVHMATQDAAFQKKSRLRRLFAEECSRFYEDLDYRLDASPYEVQQKWEDISKHSPFPSERIEKGEMKSVITEAISRFTPMLLYESCTDNNTDIPYQLFVTLGTNNSIQRTRSIGIVGMLWETSNLFVDSIVRSILRKVTTSVRDTFDSCGTLIQTLTSLSLLAFGLPAIVMMSLTLWIVSELILPRLEMEWVGPIVVKLSSLTGRAVSALLPSPSLQHNWNQHEPIPVSPIANPTQSRDCLHRISSNRNRIASPIDYDAFSSHCSSRIRHKTQDRGDSSPEDTDAPYLISDDVHSGIHVVLDNQADDCNVHSPEQSTFSPHRIPTSRFHNENNVSSIKESFSRSSDAFAFDSHLLAIGAGRTLRVLVMGSLSLLKRCCVSCLIFVYRTGHFFAVIIDLVGAVQLASELLTGTWRAGNNTATHSHVLY